MLVALCGGPGSGKTAVSALLRTAGWKQLRTVTTRARRVDGAGNLEGDNQYRFMTEEAFDAAYQRGEFLWVTELAGLPQRYAILTEDATSALSEPFAFADITPEFVATLEVFAGSAIRRIFLHAEPAVLRQRLMRRGDSNVEKKLATAHDWEEYARAHGFTILNAHLPVEEVARQIREVVLSCTP